MNPRWLAALCTRTYRSAARAGVQDTCHVDVFRGRDDVPEEEQVAAQSARSRVDLVLVATSRGKGAAQSQVLLARIRAQRASFELLTAAAWARALGYPPEELSGKPLRELVAPGAAAAQELFAALLDEDDARPLDVTLRCKDRRRKVFRFHRRVDPYGEAIFVLAEELAFAAEQTGAEPVAMMDHGR